jgi:hypothetical protein
VKHEHLKPKSMDEWAFGVLVLEAVDRGLRNELQKNLDNYINAATLLHSFKQSLAQDELITETKE